MVSQHYKPSFGRIFVQAADFLMDLSKVLSSAVLMDANLSLQVLPELFVQQQNSESALEWPSDLEKGVKLYNRQLQAFKFRTLVVIQNRVVSRRRMERWVSALLERKWATLSLFS
jgi:hypothetical protein